jgi:3-dehydroquinate dehydratase-1
MNAVKPLCVHGAPIGGGRLPLVCTPLVAPTPDAILAELATVIRKSPDAIEWRVDYFANIADTAAVVELARRIRAIAEGTPVIFTRRSEREGGARTPLGDEQAIRLYEAVCDARCAEFVDWELSNGTASVARVRDAARANGVGLIASYHNFRGTPECSVLIGKFAQAAREGADVAKVAVMPNDVGDVLALLDATRQASQSLDIPLISMSMGPLGVLSRIAGFMYGSALTFAIGAASSAPGQLAIDDLRVALDIVRRGSGVGRVDD